LTSQREFAIPIVLTKGGKTKLISIRTSQSTWIAFPRDEKDEKWGTLSDVDAVVAAWVDDAETPRFAQVHLIPGDEMRDRFDRARFVYFRAWDRRTLCIAIFIRPLPLTSNC
jgi:hypothetical protein